jgi:hypothetical protein
LNKSPETFLRFPENYCWALCSLVAQFMLQVANLEGNHTAIMAGKEVKNDKYT